MSETYQGHFLIAAPKLRDPNFQKTVVLLLEHNSEGAMGLVVNRPSSIKVAQALAKHFDLADCTDQVFAGGPVEPAALFILHNASFLDAGQSPIVEDVYIGGNAEVFESIIKTAANGHKGIVFRVYSGYSGWGGGQLESELERGDWFTQRACSELALESEPYELWDQLLSKYYASKRLLPHSTENPGLN